MKAIISDIKMNREKWLELKSKTIGSSEIGVIMESNPYKTKYQLWKEKTGRKESVQTSEAAELGLLLEDFIGNLFSKNTLLAVEKSNAMYSHDLHESFTASPDFWFLKEGERGILECKNVNWRMRDAWACGDYPPSYLHQVQWQLGVCGLSSGFLAGLVGAQVKDFYYTAISFSENLFNEMMEKAHAFLENIKTDTPPELSYLDREEVEKDLKLEAVATSLPSSMIDVLEKYEAVREKVKLLEAQNKELKKEEDSYRVLLESALGDANTAMLYDYVVEAKRIHKNEYVVKPSSYVSFSVKKEGKKL